MSRDEERITSHSEVNGFAKAKNCIQTEDFESECNEILGINLDESTKVSLDRLEILNKDVSIKGLNIDENINQQNFDMNETDPSSPNSKQKKGDRMKAAPDNISQSSNNKIMPIGDVNNIRKLRDGNLLVETSNAKQSETLLAITNFAGQFEVEASPHRSLNYSKGVIRCFDLQLATIEEIKIELNDIVTDVFRIKIKRNGVEKYSHTYILYFTTPKPPEKNRVGFLTVKVDPYIPNPYRCYNCHEYAHPTKQCKKAADCANCGQARHTGNSISEKPPSCINCSGKHNALDRKCSIFKLHKEIKAIQTIKKVSFIEAKNILREQNLNIFLK
ncbi:uncharacterized protein [Halyomorpha halys]|uniref:uncharacterized protein n=1 Tax=Halyomorpha halys TaxID=286706 RepID=UPI0034D17B39